MAFTCDRYNISFSLWPSGYIKSQIFDKSVPFGSRKRFFKSSSDSFCASDFADGLNGVSALPDYASDLSSMEFSSFSSSDVVRDSTMSPADVRRSVRRALNSINDKCRSGAWSWFVTFTFASDVVDRSDYKACVKLLRSWLTSYRQFYRRRGISVSYVFVPEFHDDGINIHFHGLLSHEPPALMLKSAYFSAASSVAASSAALSAALSAASSAAPSAAPSASKGLLNRCDTASSAGLPLASAVTPASPVGSAPLLAVSSLSAGRNAGRAASALKKVPARVLKQSRKQYDTEIGSGKACVVLSWRYGFSDASRLRDGHAAASYITKYITKQYKGNSPVPKFCSRFIASRDLEVFKFTLTLARHTPGFGPDATDERYYFPNMASNEGLRSRRAIRHVIMTSGQTFRCEVASKVKSDFASHAHFIKKIDGRRSSTMFDFQAGDGLPEVLEKFLKNCLTGLLSCDILSSDLDTRPLQSGGVVVSDPGYFRRCAAAINTALGTN